MDTLVIATILLALSFDFVNGFHDSANAIATIVVTRVLTPHQAVLIAALGNFIGAFVFPVAVATTIGKGIIDPKSVSEIVILSGLTGAIIWDLITWWLGLPTSSSHALIGGLIGAALVSSGTGAVFWSGIWDNAIYRRCSVSWYHRSHDFHCFGVFTGSGEKTQKCRYLFS